MVLVLGVGGYFYVELQAAAEQEETAEQLRLRAASELEQDPPVPGDVRRVIRDIEAQAASDPGESEWVALQARLWLHIGNGQRAWEVLETAVLQPGVSVDVLAIATEVSEAVAAERGDETTIRQAMQIAQSHYAASGEATSQRRAWLLAFRGGDVDAFLQIGQSLLDGSDATGAQLVEVLGGGLGELLAARLGLQLGEDARGPAAAAALREFLGKLGPAVGVAGLRQLSVDLGAAAPPELRVVQSMRQLEATIERLRVGGEVNEDAVSELFTVLEDLQRVLSEQAASLEARHLMVVALAGLWQVERLRDVDRTRLRGQLDWLLENAPVTDTRGEGWRRTRDALGD